MHFLQKDKLNLGILADVEVSEITNDLIAYINTHPRVLFNFQHIMIIKVPEMLLD